MFIYFRYYFAIITYGKSCGTSSEQTCIPFTQGGLVPSLVEIVLVVLEKKTKF